MAISIDAVYQKVLALANKEQRGYITPQEFNLFADKAQMEIFEQYFYDLSQFKRQPSNSGEYSDIVSIIEDKISHFEYFHAGAYNITVVNEYGDCTKIKEDIPGLYRLGVITIRYHVNGKTYNSICERITSKEFRIRAKSKLAKYSYDFPVYMKYQSTAYPEGRIKIYPSPLTVNLPGIPNGSKLTSSVRSQAGVSGGTKKMGIGASYIRRPSKPNWSYVVENNKPLYNSSNAVNFELHESEEMELVYKILTLAGIAIEKPQLTQMATGLQGAQIQQEKQ